MQLGRLSGMLGRLSGSMCPLSGLKRASQKVRLSSLPGESSTCPSRYSKTEPHNGRFPCRNAMTPHRGSGDRSLQSTMVWSWAPLGPLFVGDRVQGREGNLKTQAASPKHAGPLLPFAVRSSCRINPQVFAQLQQCQPGPNTSLIRSCFVRSPVAVEGLRPELRKAAYSAN